MGLLYSNGQHRLEQNLDGNGHKGTGFADGTNAGDLATFGQLATAGAVTSVFGRSGVVVAVAGDYYAVIPAALTGATQAFRIAGATTSGAPVSGTFAVGDLVAARDGHLFMCISAGTPGTWVDTGGSVSFATPAIALGSAAAAGSAGTAIRSDSTIAAFDTTAPSTQAFGDAAAVGTAAFAARRDHKHAMPANPSDATISTSDITTNDVSITKHGFAPKAPNDTAKFLRGDGTWNTASLPSGSAAVATDVIWDAAGDLVQATGADAAVKLSIGAAGKVLRSTGSAAAWSDGPPGMPVLVYRYTVVGSDKATIDTAVDTPDAGSNDWTNGDLLELYLYSRTDETVLTSVVYLKFNNSSTNIYDRQFTVSNNVTTCSSPNIGTAGVEWDVDGASQAANYFSHSSAYVPNFTGTVGYKAIGSQSGTAASAAANGQVFNGSHVYRDTAAITRAAISIATAGKKFKVGTQFLVYKRLAS